MEKRSWMILIPAAVSSLEMACKLGSQDLEPRAIRNRPIGSRMHLPDKGRETTQCSLTDCLRPAINIPPRMKILGTEPMM